MAERGTKGGMAVKKVLSAKWLYYLLAIADTTGKGRRR